MKHNNVKEIQQHQNQHKQGQNHRRKKKLELFFEDIMGSSSSEASRSVEEVINAEIHRYITELPENWTVKIL